MEYRVLEPDDRPRCRNQMTLAPLYTRHGPDGSILTNAYMTMDIPAEHFWRNADGFGFDTRNLAQLLRTNFRNLNPHLPYRPLWCNARDLASLLAHPDLETPRRNAVDRATRMNMLSPRTRERLATAAGELYSASYQGFVDWIESRPDFDRMMADVGYDITRAKAVETVVRIELKRRRQARKSIEAASGTQASEHMCEPVGIPTDSGLYRLLEQYKAGVASRLLHDVHLLAEREHAMVAELERRMIANRRTRLEAVLRRYVRAALKHKSVAGDFGVFQMRFTTAHGPSSDVVFDVRFLRDSLQYRLLLDGVVMLAESPAEAVRQLQTTGRGLVQGRTVVLSAAIDGGAARWCKGKNWSRRIRADNRLLRTAAALWTMDDTFVASTRSTLLSMPLDHAADPRLRETWVRQRLGRVIVDPSHVKVACRMAAEMPYLLEFSLLDGMQFNAGYDGYESGLLEKLNGALSGLTCAQDLGGALCEALSVPYAPEDHEIHAPFQCDHTNIPPALRPVQVEIAAREAAAAAAGSKLPHPPSPDGVHERRRRMLPRTSVLFDRMLAETTIV